MGIITVNSNLKQKILLIFIGFQYPYAILQKHFVNTDLTEVQKSEMTFCWGDIKRVRDFRLYITECDELHFEKWLLLPKYNSAAFNSKRFFEIYMSQFLAEQEKFKNELIPVSKKFKNVIFSGCEMMIKCSFLFVWFIPSYQQWMR